MLTEMKRVPVKSTLGAKVGVVAPVLVVLSRIEASLNSFATAKSGLPSPLKSPMLTEAGRVPVVKSTLGAKVGVVAPMGVVLSRIDVVSLLKFATTKSGLPSPLKSPIFTSPSRM